MKAAYLLTYLPTYYRVLLTGHMPFSSPNQQKISFPFSADELPTNTFQFTIILGGLKATCRLVEIDLSVEVFCHVVAEVADAVLLEVLYLGEHGVRDGIGSAVHRLQVGLRQLHRRCVLLRLRRHLLNLRHCCLNTTAVSMKLTLPAPLTNVKQG